MDTCTPFYIVFYFWPLLGNNVISSYRRFFDGVIMQLQHDGLDSKEAG
jgi:hypothetical protein